jgi:hypothetical protein
MRCVPRRRLPVPVRAGVDNRLSLPLVRVQIVPRKGHRLPPQEVRPGPRSGSPLPLGRLTMPPPPAQAMDSRCAPLLDHPAMGLPHGHPD